MKDLHSNIAVETLIGNATLDADNVPVAVDLSGFKAAEIILAIGEGGIVFDGANKIEFVLTHSEDGQAYEAVTDADMIGMEGIADGIIMTLNEEHADPASYRFGYKGNLRYLQLLADFSGAHGTGTPIAAVAVKGSPRVAPQG
ncbi:hypothetical protein [uncultured Parasphingopyxis sp.]|uniref:hypothetical protein n=1 Tax=uncultured Parasphingopyxis sp. TaxID=1547918 RepID=UPI002633CA60|nr:hypothetical protein [uncultured Parasphingopyxis sp.]